MGHRVFEEVTLGVEQRLDISHSWGLIIWCRIIDEALDNVVYGSILCQKTFGQALNGPVEGHINRLKMLKRQMFGRAHLDLLSRRFVQAPGAEPAPAPGQRTPAPALAEAEATSPRARPAA